MNPGFVKRKIRRQLPPYSAFSLLAERLTVGAGFHGGICLMGAHHDSLQRAIVGIIAMVCALLDSTLDALVCMAAHSQFLLF